MEINFKIEDGNLSVDSKKIIHTNRGRMAFSNKATDPNHTIYNNALNIDGEGAWDGMKINCYEGLKIRTGNSNGMKPEEALTVDKDGVTAKKFHGAFQLKDENSEPIKANVGTLRYREANNASYVEVCMKDGDNKYEWVQINKQMW